jgi:hypothetical protein
MQGLVSSACSKSCSTVDGVLSCMPSPCPVGYYCPTAATVPLECGEVGLFCPEGSPTPITATIGYYTTWKSYTGPQVALQYVEGYQLAARNQTTRSSQHICEKGSYCSGGGKRLCPALAPYGTYGAREGLSTAACTAPCPAGYFW